MCVYAEKLLSQVVAAATVEMDEMCLSWNGEVMCSDQITRYIQSIWRKAGLHDGLTLNIVRMSECVSE